MISRRSLALTGALLTLSGLAAVSAARADDPAPAAATPSPLTRTKTVRFKETFSIGGKDGSIHPLYTLRVQIDRSSGEKVRADMDAAYPAKPDRPFPKTSEYLLDGKKEYEYNGLNDTYTSQDAPAKGQRSHSQLRDMAGIDLILYPDRSAQATEGADIKKSVTADTLDGKPMSLTTYAHSGRPGKDGAAAPTMYTRIWSDARTGLPYRRQESITEPDGTSQVFMQTDFSDWEINPALSAAQFAWNPPAGSKPYSEPKLLAVGTPAPDFTAYTPEGKPVKLSDLKGKVVILDFWATWCGPCQRSMPHLEKVYSQVKGKDVAVLAVCVWDQKAEYDKWVTDKKGTYTFPTVFDPAGRGKTSIASSLYQVAGIPAQYVIGKDGKVASSHMGYEGDSDHTLEAALNKLGIDTPNTETKTAAR